MDADKYRYRSALLNLCKRGVADSQNAEADVRASAERVRQTCALLLAEIEDDRRAKVFQEKIAR